MYRHLSQSSVVLSQRQNIKSAWRGMTDSREATLWPQAGTTAAATPIVSRKKAMVKTNKTPGIPTFWLLRCWPPGFWYST
mmetsp:Transcript_78488/g.163067  ORF Transcript_78488/g.163067 Transcript_78488/m.163067 type:complete len:80 (-) Transcript_78488:821-1060(-)